MFTHYQLDVQLLGWWSPLWYLPDLLTTCHRLVIMLIKSVQVSLGVLSILNHRTSLTNWLYSHPTSVCSLSIIKTWNVPRTGLFLVCPIYVYVSVCQCLCVHVCVCVCVCMCVGVYASCVCACVCVYWGGYYYISFMTVLFLIDTFPLPLFRPLLINSGSLYLPDQLSILEVIVVFVMLCICRLAVTKYTTELSVFWTPTCQINDLGVPPCWRIKLMPHN